MKDIGINTVVHSSKEKYILLSLIIFWMFHETPRTDIGFCSYFVILIFFIIANGESDSPHLPHDEGCVHIHPVQWHLLERS